jgi:putative tricarboxylic transport membrane protein
VNKKDIGAALFLLAIGGIGLYKALLLPVGDLRSPDTAFMPVLLCGLLLTLALALLARAVWSGPQATLPPAVETFAKHGRKKLLLVVLTFVAYCFLLDPLGYIISTALVIIIVARLMRCGWAETVAMALICTVGSYFLIVKYLKGPLPSGLLPF